MPDHFKANRICPRKKSALKKTRRELPLSDEAFITNVPIPKGISTFRLTQKNQTNTYMKNSIKALVVMAVLAIAGTSFAQNSASANATANATIVCPLTLTNSTALSFGNITNTSGGGTATVATNGSETYNNVSAFSGTGGAGSVGAATFTVGGQNGFSFSTTLPTGALTLTGGTGNVTVDTWTTDAPTSLTGEGGCVNDNFHVGGTVHVPSGANGTFSATFSVTCAYN